MVNIIGIDFESIVDGDGVRVVIFFSGCKHNCKGCHNPLSHNFDAGRPFTEDIQKRIIDYIRNTPYISGVTLSGGDPMYSAVEVAAFVKTLRRAVPTKSVWVYSGFAYEEILRYPEMARLLSLCDVLVDGCFVLEMRDTTLSYRGSRNQRVIDVVKSGETGSVELWCE